MSNGSVGIIIERICIHHILRIFQVHIIIEHRLPGLGVIFTPVRHKDIILINHLAALKEITDTIQTVVIQTVSI